MHHLYIQINSDELALQKEREQLLSWCKKNKVEQYCWIEDNITVGRIPEKLILSLLSGVEKGDTVVVSEFSHLGRSLAMYLTVLSDLEAKEASVVSLDGRVLEPGSEFSSYVRNLRDIVAIEKSMKAFLSKNVLHARRQEGAVLGRPFGAKKKPEKIVLYGKTELLEKMRAEGVSCSAIARELGVSRGTVYNYIKDKNL